MSLILVAVLVVGGLVGTAAVIVGIPTLFGLVTYDLIESRTTRSGAANAVPKSVSLERVSLERGFARGFVIAGGVFWAVAIFAGMYSFRQATISYAIVAAFLPLAAVLATLVVGWYYERIASALLALASFAVVAWGVIYQFEVGVWMLMTLALIGPMMTAAVLFWMARRDQDAFELALAGQLELATIPTEEGSGY